MLTIEEPAGIDRKAEPVTSGVPLPKGSVIDPGKLSLCDGKGTAVPCQFTPLCRWSDGSIKWVLLDFQADIPSKGKVTFGLQAAGPSPSTAKPVAVTETDSSVSVDTGVLRYRVNKNSAGLIGSVEVNGKEVVPNGRPVQVVMVNGDGKTYKADRPTEVLVESRGPLRSTILVRGEFVNDEGGKVFDGKVGYDLRITGYAGQPDIRLAFTLKNNGYYGYRNEGNGRPRQWLYFRSLKIEVPVTATSPAGEDSWEAIFPTGRRALAGKPVSLVQWFKYPGQDARGYFDLAVERDEPREDAAGLRDATHGFYYWLSEGSERLLHGERTLGWAALYRGGHPVISGAIRRFWQNFPRGIEAAPGNLSFLLWPEGGFWPRTQEAYDRCTYQLEGGRHKTAEMILVFGEAGEGKTKAFEAPLFARAPTDWYRQTGAVWPLGSGHLTAKGDPQVDKALRHFDLLQLSKIHVSSGDPAGPAVPGGRDEWGKVSVPSLRERCPDIFYGWMNYGDLVWSFGYCSLYYDWPYAMLVQYLRLHDRGFLEMAEDMARHRYDVDQYHVRDTAPYLGLFQRYERGQHGHLARQEGDGGRTKWEGNARPSHTWNRGLLLHWALTGDARSLAVARDNGEAFYNFFYKQHNLGEKEKLVYEEFRSPAWAMENWLALYEYTGEKKYLVWAEEMFGKTLLAMERGNGSRGHIVAEGRQSAQFTGYVVEPVCRLHRLTGSQEAVEFLSRVLKWQREGCSRQGNTESGGYYPVVFVEKWDFADNLKEAAGTAYNFMLADGYAYVGHVLGDEGSLKFANRLFADSALSGAVDGGQPVAGPVALGYHHYGSPLQAAAKVHAYSGRYHQLYLWVLEQRGAVVQGELTLPVSARVEFASDRAGTQQHTPQWDVPPEQGDK